MHEDEEMRLTRSKQLEDEHRVRSCTGIVLLLAAFACLCISASASTMEEDADHWIKEGYKQMWKGSFSQANESFEKALQIYDQAIATRPGDINATLNATNKKILLLVKLGRFDEAISTLDSTIKSYPENLKAWKIKGFSLINIAEKSIAESSEAENGTVGSNTTELDGRYNQSLQAFQRALDLDPDDADAWRGRALAYSGLKDHDEALKASDKAVEIDPGYGQAWLDRGILLLEMGRTEEALFALDRALSIQPDNLDALSIKAEALTVLGRYQEAEAAFYQAMDMDSERYETGDSEVDWLL